jgi:hypothetical protein
MTGLLKAGRAEPEKTPVVRQWLCKYVSTANKSHDCKSRYTVIEELLENVFFTGFLRRLYKEKQLENVT